MFTTQYGRYPDPEQPLAVRLVGDAVLRRWARPIARIKRCHRALAQSMLATMYAHRGVGLAANQVGFLERIVVADPDPRIEGGCAFKPGPRPLVIFNPRIVARQGTDVDAEGCLSVPGLVGYVARASWVRVEGLDINGQRVTVEAEGLLARILQHEIDHLDGVLFLDRIGWATEHRGDPCGPESEGATERKSIRHLPPGRPIVRSPGGSG